jgi:uncharacterized protein (DUF433 family)/DNA-binding transcriptional MerR regulator
MPASCGIDNDDGETSPTGESHRRIRDPPEAVVLTRYLEGARSPRCDGLELGHWDTVGRIITREGRADVSYEPKMAAALSGATPRQLAYWRRESGAGGPVLVPELSSSRPILYSFRDVLALRACVQLRQKVSLQKIRRAVDALREGLGAREHLSSYRLVAGPDTVYLADHDHAVDLLKRPGNVVIREMVDVLAPFYVEGRHIPDLLQPRPHIAIDPDVRGGEPVVEGTRIPAAEVAALVRDGVAPEDVGEFFPGMSATAVRDAVDFTDYADSYFDGGLRQAAA